VHPFLYCVLYVAALGIGSHFVGQLLPRRWFCADRFPYRLYGWEKNGRIYDKIAIRKWKNKVPDMSLILKDMVKKEVEPDNTSAGLLRLVAETCVSELIHVLLILFTIPILARWKTRGGVLFFLIYNILGNLPYILIQRYNRPRLMALAGKKKLKEGLS